MLIVGLESRQFRVNFNTSTAISSVVGVLVCHPIPFFPKCRCVSCYKVHASKVHAGLDGVSPMLLFLQRPVANVEVANVEVGLGSIGLNVEDGPNLSGINFNASFAVVDL